MLYKHKCKLRTIFCAKLRLSFLRYMRYNIIRKREREVIKMKKQDTYFEKERMLFVVAVIKDDKHEASLHLGRMQGYKDALYNMGVDFTKIYDLHDRIMSSIDFAYRMRRRKKNN